MEPAKRTGSEEGFTLHSMTEKVRKWNRH